MAKSNKAILSTAKIEENKKTTKKSNQSDMPHVTSEWLVNAFNVALAWIDVNLMPVICLGVLCAFAVIGFASKLNNLSDVQRAILSIAIVALLAVKTGRVIHKK